MGSPGTPNENQAQQTMNTKKQQQQQQCDNKSILWRKRRTDDMYDIDIHTIRL